MGDPITIGMVATIVIAIVSFLTKMMIDDFKKSILGIGAKLDENMDKVDERITALETQQRSDIKEVRKELNSIKGDFATSFVLREDFFRSMNGVEEKMKSIDNKLDKILLK